MASVFLLSAFAGIGFFMTNDVSGASGLGDGTIVNLTGNGGFIGIVIA